MWRNSGGWPQDQEAKDGVNAPISPANVYSSAHIFQAPCRPSGLKDEWDMTPVYEEFTTERFEYSEL